MQGGGLLRDAVAEIDGEGSNLSELIGSGQISGYAAEISGEGNEDNAGQKFGEGTFLNQVSIIAGIGSDRTSIYGSGHWRVDPLNAFGRGSNVSELVGSGNLATIYATILGEGSDASELVGSGVLIGYVASSVGHRNKGDRIAMAATMVGEGTLSLPPGPDRGAYEYTAP